jgi:hypothetical protein
MADRRTAPGRRIRCGSAGLVIAALVGAGLAGCSGSSNGPAATAGSGASASTGTAASSQSSKAAEQVTQQYLKAAPPAVLASVSGQVVGSDGHGTTLQVAGTVDLLSVRAGPNSTAVRWRMSTVQPFELLSSSAYRTAELAVPDVSAVTLVATQANLLLRTGHWLQPSDCTCAWLPNGLDSTGVEMSILYPALPASVTEVQLKVPGFPAVSGPVTRS